MDVGPLPEEMPAPDPDLLEALREANARAEQAERSLARMQASFQMTVGQLVIDAGQSPRKLLKLPFTLLRMRRNRRSMRATKARRSTSESTDRSKDNRLSTNPGGLLLPRRVVTADRRPSYLVIGPPGLTRALDPHAHVSACLPHNAIELTRALNPDAVIIHAHAGHDGGAWAPLGEPGEAMRESVLLEVREMCASLGRPVVVVHDPTIAPGLTPFASTCDFVIQISEEARLPDLLMELVGRRDA